MKVDLTPTWLPFLEPHRYKIAYGGRGSGKSWTIAALLVAEACSRPTRILCAREIQRSISDSVLQLLSDTIDRLGAGSFFDVQRTQILGENGSRFLFEGLRSNVTKIKSMEGIDRVWVEEAESVTRSSWETLIPTIRSQGSEIWCSFNPLDELDDTYQRFCVNTPPDTALIKVNWQDNPFFPPELDRERLHMRSKNKDLYQHIWEGDCLSNRDGAYYAKYINDAQVLPILPEPSIPVITSWDLGMADSTAIWFIQPFLQEFRVIHSYENSGEGLQHYVNYLHDYRAKSGIVYGDHFAPHDVRVRELGPGRSRLATARKLGINFKIAPLGSIEDGIHSVRQIIPRCWFNSSDGGCQDGLRAIRRYRKEFDERLGVYKSNPLHDWSSHYADSLRYFAVSYREKRTARAPAIADMGWSAFG